MKEEGIPFKMVADKSLVMPKVTIIPKRIIRVSSAAEYKDVKKPLCPPMINIVSRAIRVGNLPLQGTKLLVSIANNRSRGESMMRHPTTPAALHPKPIHMVSACFPQAQQR